MRLKDIVTIVLLLPLILYFIPKTTILYLACGFFDFRRSNQFASTSYRRYFLGNGITTWLLSPFNLLVDLFSHKNKGIFTLNDLPESHRAEIKQIIAITNNNSSMLIDELNNRMQQKKRGMIFFKWYGRDIDNSLTNTLFSQKFKYIKTIGISVFNKNQATSIHYGPLRLSLRVLYNLVPNINDNIYIDVANKRHYWHNNPLFIFDDTLVHQSVNYSENIRYCMFIDIIRPSNYYPLLNFLLDKVRVLIIYFNRLFYKNWEFLK